LVRLVGFIFTREHKRAIAAANREARLRQRIVQLNDSAHEIEQRAKRQLQKATALQVVFDEPMSTVLKEFFESKSEIEDASTRWARGDETAEPSEAMVKLKHSVIKMLMLVGEQPTDAMVSPRIRKAQRDMARQQSVNRWLGLFALYRRPFITGVADVADPLNPFRLSVPQRNKMRKLLIKYNTLSANIARAADSIKTLRAQRVEVPAVVNNQYK
jgi:hypothetical protein